jgi:hypothetical protein
MKLSKSDIGEKVFFIGVTMAILSPLLLFIISLKWYSLVLSCIALFTSIGSLMMSLRNR